MEAKEETTTRVLTEADAIAAVRGYLWGQLKVRPSIV